MLTEREIQDFINKYGLRLQYERYIKKSPLHKKLADHTIDAIARDDCQKLEILSIIAEHLARYRDRTLEDAVWEFVVETSDQLKCPIARDFKTESICEDLGIRHEEKEHVLEMVRRLVK